MPRRKKSTHELQLEAQLRQAKQDLQGYQCALRDVTKANDQKREELSQLKERTREEVRPLYVIEELRRGGERVGIHRISYVQSSHELLGLLEMAVEDVKLQIRGQMSQPKRTQMVMNGEERTPSTHN